MTLPLHWQDFLTAARGGRPERVPVALIVDSPWMPGFARMHTLDFFLDTDAWLDQPEAGWTPVVIEGGNFVAGVTATLDGTPLVSVTLVSSSRLTAADLAFHEKEYQRLTAELEQAGQDSSLPEAPMEL